MDVTDLSQVDHALASLPKAWERVDVLVNNAGLVSRPRPSLWSRDCRLADHDSDQYCRPDLSDKENLAPDGGTKWWLYYQFGLYSRDCALSRGQCLRGIQGFCQAILPQSSGGSSWQEDSCQQYWTWSLRRTEFSSIRFKGDEKTVEASSRCPCHSAGRHCQHRSLVDPTAQACQCQSDWNHAGFPNLWPSTCLSWLKRSNHSTWGWLFFIFPLV